MGSAIGKSTCFLILTIVSLKGYSQIQTYSTPGDGNFQIPHKITSITVETWGSGGKGASTNRGGGGGGYSRSDLVVTPGLFYPYTVGMGAIDHSLPGGNTSFGSPNLVKAEGGKSTTTNVGGIGGLAVNGLGTIKFNGGNGAPQNNGNIGGGGGSSAGENLPGESGIGQNGGVAPTGGGNGGDGGINGSEGSNGFSPGGGGGGAGGNNLTGGKGANGQIRISWVCSSSLISGNPNQTICLGNSVLSTRYSIEGAYGANVVGLPSGVVGTYSNGDLVISGSPSQVGSFDYTITPIGSCIGSIISGNITVNPLNEVQPINEDSFCEDLPLSGVYQSTFGVTGIGSSTNLPPGISAHWENNQILFEGTPTTPGIFDYSIELLGGCYNGKATGSITVNQTAEILSPSLEGQTECIFSAFSPLTVQEGIGFSYQWFRNTSPSTVGGIPISGATNANFGPPSNFQGTSFYYVEVTGSCGAKVTSAISGPLIVTPGNTVGSPSTSPSGCINIPITSIIHATSGANGIGSPINLPEGINATWDTNQLIISGTPTESGIFNYTIPLIGGCGSANATGTITVYEEAILENSNLSTQTICFGSEFAPHSVGDKTGFSYQWYNSNGTPISGQTNSIFAPPSDQAGSNSYFIRITDSCGNTVDSPNSGILTVNPLPTVTFINQPTSDTCVEIPTTYETQPGMTAYTWTLPGQSEIDYSIIGGGTVNDNFITVKWLTPGIKSLSVNYSNENSCRASVDVNSAHLIVRKNTVSPSSNPYPSVCLSYPTITPFKHITTLAEGIGTPSGLPAGLTANFLNGEITISGTLNSSATPGIYNYSIPLTGGCGSVSATGFIEVTPTYTLTKVTSVSPTAPNGTASITINGDPKLLINGSYTVEYSLGLANSGTGTATFNTINGRGTFLTFSIPNTELTTLTIHNLKKSTDSCSVPISTNNVTYFGVCSAAYDTNGDFFVPAGIYEITLKVWGGGGKGGSAGTNGGGGGGGGGYSTITIPVLPGQHYTVVVGAGGTSEDPSGGVSYVTGNPGSHYTTSSVIYATGGLGASGSTGGNAGIGDPRQGRASFPGVEGESSNTDTGAKGGQGGNNGGLGGLGAASNSSTSSIGMSPGGGGGGGFGSGVARNGSNGGSGIVLISYSCPNADPNSCLKVVDDGAISGNTILQFVCDDKWNIPEGLIEFQVITGGGGGGGGNGLAAGGGGSGGLRSASIIAKGNFGFEAGQSINIDIGDGGIGSDSKDQKGGDGQNTAVTGTIDGNQINIIGIGGGGGGSDSNQNGNPGGSGGGGAYNNLTNSSGSGGNGTIGIGRNGGNGIKNTDNNGNQEAVAGGGGGGVGTQGTLGNPNGNGTAVGGNGGNPVQIDFENTSFVKFFGAGGGGTGTNFNGTDRNAGGSGGVTPEGEKIGGDGNVTPGGVGGMGVPNTGSGGGGAYGKGGNGGSGVVFITFFNLRILGVEYLYFEAEADQDLRESILTWATLLENGNSHFEIERAVHDIKTWKIVGKVSGIGYSNQIQKYTFKDKDIPASGGRFFYRIRQVSVDNTTNVSPIQAVQVNPLNSKGKWIAYPNPSIQGSKIQIELLDRTTYEDEPILIQITNIKGVFSQLSVYQPEEVNQAINHYLENKKAGLYIIHLTWGNKIEQISLVRK